MIASLKIWLAKCQYQSLIHYCICFISSRWIYFVMQPVLIDDHKDFNLNPHLAALQITDADSGPKRQQGDLGSTEQNTYQQIYRS